ncbi:hypothetical protein [Brevundimonas lenta]|uniref:Uncharacterized protein n=1 Tax=Brevundimonas lenta TaxID=424796 RepID=A0A7W6JH58_9CAUL|nr:hypothetical protein [Brevundimonas lenta]MBB4084046.1 hypothetical protein [Brevundimonas lenta]
MALDLPETPPPAPNQPHPALCLAAGFGLIVLCAIVVHVVFNAVL